MAKIVWMLMDILILIMMNYWFICREGENFDLLTWVLLGMLTARVTFTVWCILRKRRFIEITDDFISLNGTKFERSNIRSGRVLSLRQNKPFAMTTEFGRYVEIAFKTPPVLPLSWKISELLECRMLPLRCARGKLLAREPRVIVPIGQTDLTDQEINQALNCGAAHPAPSPPATPPPRCEP